MQLKKYCYILILGLLITGFYACKKDGDLPPAAPVTAQLNVINAITDLKAVNFYLNGTRQNNNSAIYFLNSSGYIDVPIGEQQYQIKNDDSLRTLLGDIKLDLPKADSSYTLLLAGQQNAGTVTPIFINDYFVTDTSNTGAAKIRFIQGSPGSNAYDVFVGDTVSFKNMAFKSSAGFQSVGPGVKTIKINIAGSNTTVFQDNTTLQSNSYYTLYTQGVPGGAGNNAFSVVLNLTR